MWPFKKKLIEYENKEVDLEIILVRIDFKETGFCLKTFTDCRYLDHNEIDIYYAIAAFLQFQEFGNCLSGQNICNIEADDGFYYKTPEKCYIVGRTFRKQTFKVRK